MKNWKYKATGDYEFEKEPVSKTELLVARETAKKLMKNVDKIAMRSCWVCNAAHTHFLSGKWGSWVLNCFDCGHWYFNKIDITVYEK